MPAPSSPAPTADLESLAAQLLDAAKAAGADAADAIAVAGDSLSIEVRMGALEQAERAEGIDIGLRVLIGQRQACVSSSDTRADDDPGDGRAGGGDGARGAGGSVVRPRRPGRRSRAAGTRPPSTSSTPSRCRARPTLQEAALAAEAAAMAVPGVSKIDGAGASWSASRFHLAATNGFTGGFGRTGHGIQAVAICGDGTAMERDYAYDSRVVPRRPRRRPRDRPAGRGAGGGDARRRRSRRPAPFPVLYDERVVRRLIGHLVQAINGVAVTRGASWLEDALGERVLPAGIDLIEDPRRPRVRRSRPFDGEGLPVGAAGLRRRRGAARLGARPRHRRASSGMASTGNANRGTSAPPSPGVGNLALTQGRPEPRGAARRDGDGPARHLDDRRHDQPHDRRLFPRRQRLLGREGRDRAPGQRMHDRRQPARHAADHRAGERRATLASGRVVPSLLVEGLVVAGA